MSAFLQRRGNVARAEDILSELAEPLAKQHRGAVVSSASQTGASELDRRAEDCRCDSTHWRRPSSSRSNFGCRLLADGIDSTTVSVLFKTLMRAAAPGAVQPMVTLVNALVRAGKIGSGNDYFCKPCLRSNPDNAEAHGAAGLDSVRKKCTRNRPSRAFETAIERQPKNMAGYQALADFYVREKNNDEALKVIRAGLAAATR